jgi:phosphoribosylaminoimidazole (AIR) synthetase
MEGFSQLVCYVVEACRNFYELSSQKSGKKLLNHQRFYKKYSFDFNSEKNIDLGALSHCGGGGLTHNTVS